MDGQAYVCRCAFYIKSIRCGLRTLNSVRAEGVAYGTGGQGKAGCTWVTLDALWEGFAQGLHAHCSLLGVDASWQSWRKVVPWQLVTSSLCVHGALASCRESWPA